MNTDASVVLMSPIQIRFCWQAAAVIICEPLSRQFLFVGIMDLI